MTVLLSIPRTDAPLSATKVGTSIKEFWSVETWEIEGVNGDRVPFTLSRSDVVAPKVVLLGGHGLYGSKSAPYMKGAARRWTEHGVVTLIPDLPFHGGRATEGADLTQAMEPAGFTQALGDLARCMDFIKARDETKDLPIVYWGFSMGVIFGVPLTALDSRVAALCLVVGGSKLNSFLEENPKLPSSTVDQMRMLDPATYGAATKSRPVLMLNADKDQQFSRRDAFDLFDSLGTPKQLTFFEGTHSEWTNPLPVFDSMLAFVLRLGF